MWHRSWLVFDTAKFGTVNCLRTSAQISANISAKDAKVRHSSTYGGGVFKFLLRLCPSTPTGPPLSEPVRGDRRSERGASEVVIRRFVR